MAGRQDYRRESIQVESEVAAIDYPHAISRRPLTCLETLFSALLAWVR